MERKQSVRESVNQSSTFMCPSKRFVSYLPNLRESVLIFLLPQQNQWMEMTTDIIQIGISIFMAQNYNSLERLSWCMGCLGTCKNRCRGLFSLQYSTNIRNQSYYGSKAQSMRTIFCSECTFSLALLALEVWGVNLILNQIYSTVLCHLFKKPYDLIILVIIYNLYH